jgi:hypothetical protein
MIAFRTDKETAKRLNDAAVKLSKTKTEILNEALHMYLEGSQPSARPRRGLIGATPIQDSIGIWDGPVDSSVSTGQRFGDILVESRATRRL